MLPYLAASGAIAVLMWVRDPAEARRVAAFGISLGGGCALGFAIFASYANRAPVCDALSPVWLSAMVAAGAIALVLAMLTPQSRAARFGLAALGGLLLAGAFALAWPDCLGRLEHSSPELDRLWLSRVREAMPIWRHGAETAILTLSLPVAGLIGYLLMAWTHRRDAARLMPWATIGLLGTIGMVSLFWQTRFGPAAQLLSIPGATALAWAAIDWIMRQKLMLVRVAGVAGAFLVVSGSATGWLRRLVQRAAQPRPGAVNIANNTCPTLGALAPVAGQPRGMVLTFVDLGPG